MSPQFSIAVEAKFGRFTREKRLPSSSSAPLPSISEAQLTAPGIGQITGDTRIASSRREHHHRHASASPSIRFADEAPPAGRLHEVGSARVVDGIAETASYANTTRHRLDTDREHTFPAFILRPNDDNVGSRSNADTLRSTANVDVVLGKSVDKDKTESAHLGSPRSPSSSAQPASDATIKALRHIDDRLHRERSRPRPSSLHDACETMPIAEQTQSPFVTDEFGPANRSKFSSWSSSTMSAMKADNVSRMDRPASQEPNSLSLAEEDWGSIGPPSPAMSSRGAKAMAQMGLGRSVQDREDVVPRQPSAQTTIPEPVIGRAEDGVQGLVEVMKPRPKSPTAKQRSDTLHDRGMSHVGSSPTTTTHSNVSFASIKIWRECVAVEREISRVSVVTNSCQYYGTSMRHGAGSLEPGQGTGDARGPHGTLRRGGGSDLSLGTSNRRRISAQEAARLFELSNGPGLSDQGPESQEDVPLLGPSRRKGDAMSVVAHPHPAQSASSSIDTFGLRSDPPQSLSARQRDGPVRSTESHDAVTAGTDVPPPSTYVVIGDTPLGCTEQEPHMPSANIREHISASNPLSTPAARKKGLQDRRDSERARCAGTGPPTSEECGSTPKATGPSRLADSAWAAPLLQRRETGEMSLVSARQTTFGGSQLQTAGDTEHLVHLIANRVGVAGNALLSLQQDLLSLTEARRQADRFHLGASSLRPAHFGQEDLDAGGHTSEKASNQAHEGALESLAEQRRLPPFQQVPASTKESDTNSNSHEGWTIAMPSGLVAADSAPATILANAQEDVRATTHPQPSSELVQTDRTDVHGLRKAARPTSMPVQWWTESERDLLRADHGVERQGQ
ncbi:unnamed protein product [Parajaminaea phylloscopi]